MNVGREAAELQRMTVKELRARFAEVFGEETRAHNKAWLVKRIAWRIQALAEGDLSERAKQRAEELARDADLRLTAPKGTATIAVGPERTRRVHSARRVPLPNSILKREYKGRSHEVKVLEKGFEYEGQRYKSLSAVARAITGQHCNGFHFFRLQAAGGDQ